MDESQPADGRHRQDRDPSAVTGTVLIAVGLLLFVLQFVTGLTVTLLFLAAGVAFLLAYFNKKAFHLLIPGCILIGIAIGNLGEESSVPIQNMSALGLGIGFTAIYVIEKGVRGKAPWWPLVVGLILIFAGVGAGHIDFGKLLSRGWPLIIVVVGVLYLKGRIGPHHRQRA